MSTGTSLPELDASVHIAGRTLVCSSRFRTTTTTTTTNNRFVYEYEYQNQNENQCQYQYQYQYQYKYLYQNTHTHHKQQQPLTQKKNPHQKLENMKNMKAGVALKWTIPNPLAWVEQTVAARWHRGRREPLRPSAARVWPTSRAVADSTFNIHLDVARLESCTEISWSPKRQNGQRSRSTTTMEFVQPATTTPGNRQISALVAENHRNL